MRLKHALVALMVLVCGARAILADTVQVIINEDTGTEFLDSCFDGHCGLAT